MFGDGATSILQNPSHTYSSAGTYTINFSSTGYGGQSWYNVSNLITVGTQDFVGNPTTYSCPKNVYNQGQCDATIQFNDNTTNYNSNVVNWSFGDGIWSNTSVMSSKNVSHKYTSIGTYTVKQLIANTTAYPNIYSLTKVNYITVGESVGGGNVGYSIAQDMPGMLLYISAMIILAIFVTVLMMWYRPKNW
jgi:PKD repeat protein